MEETLKNILAPSFSGLPILSVFFAFAGGLLSSLSPCTLGMIPIVMGYVGGCSENTTKKTAIQVIFFVFGLCTVLTALGVIAAMTGKVLGFHSNPIFGLLLGSLIMVFGLTLLELLEIPMPSIVKQMPKNTSNDIVFYPMILGATFGIASTPCSTPVLAGIMAYASLKSNIMLGATLLFFYALGQSSILVFAGLFTSLFKKMDIVKKYSEYFNRLCGVALVLAAIFIYLKVFGILG